MKKPSQSNSLRFAGLLVIFLLLSEAAHAGPNEKLAPDFTLKSLDGREITLEAYKGKFLLVNFWATWCVPCKVEMPSLEELYRRFKNKNFELLAISNDMFGEKVVRPFIESREFTFPVLLDPVLTVSHRFGVVGLPASFLIDPEGKIVGVIQGAEDWSTPKMISYFESLLKPKIGTPAGGKKAGTG